MVSTTPTPRESWWMDWHDLFLARKAAGRIDLLFLGDSITQGWMDDGRATWDREYGPLNAANFGIGGDETQQLLWRLGNGELDGLSPRGVVLLIGTNNLGNGGQTADQTAAGVAAVVDLVRAELPASNLLVLGVFPRDKYPGTPLRLAIETVNRSVEAKAGEAGAAYLDLAPTFLGPGGVIDEAVMPDYLHLSPAAYADWAEAMRVAVATLLG